MSEHIDGEDERCAVLISQATAEFARATKRPVPEHVREMLAWLVREAFRRGYAHAHDRTTLKDDLWAVDEEEVKK